MFRNREMKSSIAVGAPSSDIASSERRPSPAPPIDFAPVSTPSRVSATVPFCPISIGTTTAARQAKATNVAAATKSIIIGPSPQRGVGRRITVGNPCFPKTRSQFANRPPDDAFCHRSRVFSNIEGKNVRRDPRFVDCELVEIAPSGDNGARDGHGRNLNRNGPRRLFPKLWPIVDPAPLLPGLPCVFCN